MKKNHTKKTQQKIVREVFGRIENAVNRDEKNNIFSVAFQKNKEYLWCAYKKILFCNKVENIWGVH